MSVLICGLSQLKHDGSFFFVKVNIMEVSQLCAVLGQGLLANKKDIIYSESNKMEN